MRLTLAGETGMNAAACDRLLAALTTEMARSASQVIVDLRGASFVAPYGAALLVLIAQELRRQGKDAVVVLPSGRRAQQQTMQLGLIEALRPLAELRNLPAAPTPTGAPGLALRSIASASDVQGVVAYLVHQAQSRLGFDVGDVLDAAKVVSELCHNVVDHSDSQGLVAAQIYHARDGRRMISLAVVDAGIGIRGSLSRRYPEATNWSDSYAIEQALGGLSSRPSGGGAGLRNVQAVVRRYRGELSVRSGDRRVVLTANHQPRTLDGVFFAGTQVGISFSQRLV